MVEESVYITDGEVQTEATAYSLAEGNFIRAGDIVALRGEMGAGKTAFTRGLAKYFAPDVDVTSPTYTLVNEYKAARSFSLLHFDMYRISNEDDLLGLGFFDIIGDMRNRVAVIEWYENIAEFYREATVTVDIKKDDSKPERRTILITREI
ncbi:tRNA (adenosine(37)-N6)-threonylcarbamoyltransferase complex ATPase subunit type 1 TsaE [Clostridia bacterium]|nr:tRNA (adenosine(37)-N6)-threonylcarbamoyltransferase complex ATPase subunit type 1 TsaE [Clostridia bacterium]